MIGLATLLSGARLWMKTDTAYLCCRLADDNSPYVSSRLNTKYGLQQNTNAASCVIRIGYTIVCSGLHEWLRYNVLISWPLCYRANMGLIIMNSVLNCPRLVTIERSVLWDVISPQTLCCEIGDAYDETRSWNKQCNTRWHVNLGKG